VPDTAQVKRAWKLAKAYWRLTRRSDDPYRPYEWLGRAYDEPLNPSRRLLGLLVPAAIGPQAAIHIRQTVLNTVRIAATQALIKEADCPGQVWALALPPTWRRALAASGIRVAPLRSAVAWLRLQVAVLRGVIGTMRNLERRAWRGWRAPPQPYTVFMGCPSHGMEAAPKADGYGYFDWVRRNSDLFAADDRWMVVSPAGVTPVYRDAQRQAVHEPLPRLSGLSYVLFLAHAAYLFVVALCLMLFGRWWAVFLCAGAIELAYCRRITDPASQYVFTIASGVLGRPLWSYWMEHRGIPSTMVYYATNIDPLPGPWPFRTFPGMELQSWTRYVVFSNEQAVRVRKAVVGAPAILVRGPIDYADSPDVQIELPERTILVFDTPVRKLLWNPANGLIDHYYTPDFAERFFEDIALVAERLEATVAWKAKRIQVGNHGPLALRYVKAIESVAKRVPLIYIDPNISARRLAQHAALCVAAPFTSAAVSFQCGGGRSAYYDALGRIPADRYRNDDIPMFSARGALEDWAGRIIPARSGMTKRILS
jgi:hypothetical protein